MDMESKKTSWTVLGGIGIAVLVILGMTFAFFMLYVAACMNMPTGC